jgi:putative lumazine-binding protein
MSAQTMPAAESAAIEAAVGHYFAAVGRGEPEELPRAFHPDALMQSVQNGTLVRVSQTEWAHRLAAAPSPPPAAVRRIESIDLEGTAAAVKAVADFPTFQFLDYLLLLKLDGRWLIVAKTFHRRDK